MLYRILEAAIEGKVVEMGKIDHLGNQTYLNLLIECLGASSDLVLIYVRRGQPRENVRVKAPVTGVDLEANCHIPNTGETQHFSAGRPGMP